MTLFKKFTPAIIVTCLLTTAVFANQSETPQDGYKIQVLDNCQVVKEYDMTVKQIDAYLALKAEGDKMKSLEIPITAIQDDLDNYSEQIEELTSLAIQENDDSLYIDKNYMKQQKQVVEKLNILMAAHQKDFDALGKQGKKIGYVANLFTESLEGTIGDIKGQQIHISSPDDQDNNYQCHNGIFEI